MARPISWQSDLANIHRRVSESPRSPYSREDLQKLFGVAERAARQLMELMVRTKMGNIQVVEREHLKDFLGGAVDAEDLGVYLEALRKNPPSASRRKLRLAIPREYQEGNLQSLQRGDIWLDRGKLTIDFSTLEDFAGKLQQLLGVLSDPAFERRYCARSIAAPPTPEELLQAQDVKRIQAETKVLHKLESIRHTLDLRTLGLEDGNQDDASMKLAIAELLRSEAYKLIDELGPDSEDVATKSRAYLADALPFPQASPGVQSTASPALNFPPVAEPSLHSAHEDRSAS